MSLAGLLAGGLGGCAPPGQPAEAEEKWIAILGDSNANVTRWTVDVTPANATIHRRALDGSELGISGFDWGPADPWGYRAEAAAEYATAGGAAIPQVAIFWSGGTNDAIHGTTTYGDDLIAFIADMDTRLGRSDVFWGVPITNINMSLGDVTNVRAGALAAAAAYPGRVTAFYIDDLPLDADGGHYVETPGTYEEIWARFRAAGATRFGVSGWTP